MTTKTELLKIIRHQCVTCCGGSFAEVEACQGGKRTNEYTTCHLHPFRFGTDPFAEVSEAKKEQGRKLAESRRALKENMSIAAGV
jgi:hypothetical protein